MRRDDPRASSLLAKATKTNCGFEHPTASNQLQKYIRIRVEALLVLHCEKQDPEPGNPKLNLTFLGTRIDSLLQYP